jgi:alkylation response protein AidB-like acyl-CoA dehydrogenase
VSHPIVDAMIELESARSLTLAAAAALDSQRDGGQRDGGQRDGGQRDGGQRDGGQRGGGHDAEIYARMAKAAACEALSRVTARGVQLHGGFGFTWDCDMHFYFRRAIHDRGHLGDPLHHRRVLAEILFADGVTTS